MLFILQVLINGSHLQPVKGVSGTVLDFLLSHHFNTLMIQYLFVNISDYEDAEDNWSPFSVGRQDMSSGSRQRR